MQRPKKPHPDFPLFPEANGQWAKKVNQKKYYFGSWKEDASGTAALKSWLARKDGILAGLDKVRVTVVAGEWTAGRLREEFLAAKAAAVASGELSPRTYADYDVESAKFVAAIGADAPVTNLRPEHFAAFARKLTTERKMGRHARKRVIAYIRAMFNWGDENGYFPAPRFGTEFKVPDTSPAAIRQAKMRAGIVDTSDRLFTGEDIDRMLGVAQAQYRAIILLGINCGLGPADIARLRWKHVDLETGAFDMPRGKTGEERRGYLWKKTRRALGRVMKLRHNAAVLRRLGPEATIFTSKRSQEPLDGQWLSRAMTRIIRRAGLKRLNAYRLRHTFKTLGKRGRDHDALNLMMGHKERTTGEIYDHERIGMKRLKRVSVAVYRGLWAKVPA